MVTKAYGYLRVSGKGQVDGDGFARQRAAIEKYAGEQGIEVVGWFQEKGVSGTKEASHRPAWIDMMNRIINNGVRTVLIEKLDRLARDIIIQETIIADMRKREIALVSVYEPDLCTDDPTRKLLRQFMGCIAEYDKSMIVLKLRGARERVKAATGRCEGRKPYGDRPGEEDVLVEIYRQAKSGLNPTAIARDLNERGVKSRSGKAWHPFVVSRLVEGMPCIACHEVAE